MDQEQRKKYAEAFRLLPVAASMPANPGWHVLLIRQTDDGPEIIGTEPVTAWGLEPCPILPLREVERSNSKTEIFLHAMLTGEQLPEKYTAYERPVGSPYHLWPLDALGRRFDPENVSAVFGPDRKPADVLEEARAIMMKIRASRGAAKAAAVSQAFGHAPRGSA